MSAENVLISLSAISFLMIAIIDLFNSSQFRSNKEKYEELLAEYRSHGFDIDIMTNYAVYFGSFANYQKIIWFVRLYKGVRIKFTRERYVQLEAYEFIQSLPDSRISWIMQLHRLYKIQAYIVTFWLAVTTVLLMLYK